MATTFPDRSEHRTEPQWLVCGKMKKENYTMNRKERRAAASRQRNNVPLADIYKRFDITVEGKDTNADGVEMPKSMVMIYANAKGREITEDLWPDVEWTRDIFSRGMPEDWKFTHVFGYRRTFRQSVPPKTQPVMRWRSRWRRRFKPSLDRSVSRT
jgi:hypothetical protein